MSTDTTSHTAGGAAGTSTVRATSEGDVRLPMHFASSRMVCAWFRASRGAAASLLAPAGLEPRTVAGRALAQVVFYDYGESPIGPYLEMGLAIAVDPPDRRSGLLVRDFHILDLPVSTAAARAAGREIWGYPKTVEQITLDVDGRDVSCTVRAAEDDEARPALELAGRRSRGIPVPAYALRTLSRLGTQLLAADVTARCTVWSGAGSGMRLRVNGESQLARHVHALGIDGARPALVMWAPRWRSALHEGVRVA